MKKQSSYIYLRMPKEVNDARGVLDEDPSLAHITLLYIGKISRKEFDSIVNQISILPFEEISVSLSDAVMYFDTSGKVTVDAHYTKVAYMPCSLHVPGKDPTLGYRVHSDRSMIHERMRRIVDAAGVKKVAHHAGTFTPHLTLRYLYEPNDVSARTDKSLAKRALIIAGIVGAYLERSIYVDWGDSHTARVDLANKQIYEERW